MPKECGNSQSAAYCVAAYCVRGSASGGDDGVRTRDLVVANHALSQLSYIPSSNPRPQLRNPQYFWAYLDSNQGPQLYQSCALAN